MNRSSRLPFLAFSASTLVVATFAVAAPVQEPSAPADVARDAVQAFDKLFAGPHAGSRAVHAKGVLVEGMFLPSADAGALNYAEHLQAPVPVLVRFSDFAGIPAVPDGSDVASPRGMSIKFELPDGGDTDIVAHSYDGFPAATGEEFVAFLSALAASDPAVLKSHLASHPAAQTFVATPKPAPESFATERFFGVNAFRFTNTAGVSRFGRYRIEPFAGSAHLTEVDAARRSPDYLAAELQRRLRQGPAEFHLLVQIAAATDDVTDGSTPWPAERQIIDLGVLRLTTLVPDSAEAQREILFTPLNLVGGIAPSADPLLIARTRAYRVSFERRRGRSDTTGSTATSEPVR